MDNIKSVSSKLNFLLLPAVDAATFIGSGLLASYSSIWVNDPTTQSGIVLAGFSNAAALGIVNHYKTDENSSFRFKAILTIVTLAITTFTTRYLAIALKDRFVVILSKEAAFQIGFLNLAAKAFTYVLYLLGSRLSALKIPATFQEVKDLSNVKVKEFYDFFQTPPGKEKWEIIPKDIRRQFLNTFCQKNLAFFPFDDLVKEMSICTNGDLIKNYTKNQASWLHKVLLANLEGFALSNEAIQAYVTLFFNHDLPPLPQTENKKDRISSKDFTLPIPNLDAINTLTESRVRWYSLFVSNNSLNWRLFSLDKQCALKLEFLKYQLPNWTIIPSSTQDILTCMPSTVHKLWDRYIHSDSPERWSALSSDFQSALNTKFAESKMNTFIPHPKIPKDVVDLPEKYIEGYYKAYSDGDTNHIFSEEIEKAFHTRFAASRLQNLPKMH